MKKLSLTLLLLFTSLSLSAQEVMNMSEEEITAMAKEECIRIGADPEWFGGPVRISQRENNRGWLILFDAKPDENGRVRRGDHMTASISPDGKVFCMGGE